MKHTFGKRLGALTLCLCLMLSLLPGTALAAAPTGVTVERCDFKPYIFANGHPITLREGATPGTTRIYLDSDPDNPVTPTSVGWGTTITGSAAEGYDLSKCFIFGGSKNATVASTSITMTGGSVTAIYGGGYNDDVSTTADVTGDTAVTVKGTAKVGSVYGGGGVFKAAAATVGGGTTVTVGGSAAVAGNVYGGGQSPASGADVSVTGSTHVTIQDSATVAESVSGGGYPRKDVTATVGGSTVEVTGGSVGSVAGAILAEGATDTVTITGGRVGGVGGVLGQPGTNSTLTISGDAAVGNERSGLRLDAPFQTTNIERGFSGSVKFFVPPSQYFDAPTPVSVATYSDGHLDKLGLVGPGAADKGLRMDGDTVMIHTHSGNWMTDAAQHWKVCKICSVEIVRGDHVYDDSDTDTDCNTCGHTRTFHSHTLKKTEARDPTCTETGNKAYWICEGCGKVYSDADAATETTVEKMTIPATGHNWAAGWTRDATHHWHTCGNANCPVTDNAGKDGYAVHTYTDDADRTCGDCNYVRDRHTHGAVIFGTAIDSISGTMTLASGNYYLSGDVTGRLVVPANATVKLCLNGHKIDADGNGSVISVNAGATLDIYDCNSSNGTHSVADPLGGENITISGGLITGGTGTSEGGRTKGGGIYLAGTSDSKATLNLHGGTIAGNTANDSGGLFMAGAAVNLYGGAVSHNTATGGYGAAGGVWLHDGTLQVSGNSRIEGNKGGVGGIVVNENGSLTLSDNAAVTGNLGTKQGGVSAAYGNVTVSGGARITGNTAGGKASDLVLGSGSDPAMVAIGEGGLREGAKIGVTLLKADQTVFTTGGGGAYRDYFVSNQPGRFVMEKEAELALEPYAITTQPTAEAPTVEVNNAAGASYQWYSATVSVKPVVEDPAEGETAGKVVDGQGSYADGVWNSGDSNLLVLTYPVQAGDVVTVTPTGKVTFTAHTDQGEHGDFVRNQDTNTYTSVATADKSASWGGKCYFKAKAPFSVTITITHTDLGEAVTGQTTNTLTTTATGTYVCKVTWPDGTALVSEPVPIAHTHSWSYTANGGVITAACEDGGTCDIPGGSGGTVTLTPPAGGLTYDANPHNAAVENKLNTGAAVSEITYQYSAAQGGDYADTTNTAAAGWYRASVTVGSVTVTVSYQVQKATNTWTTQPSIANVTYGTAIAPQYAAQFGEVTITYQGAGGTSSTEAPTAAGSYTATFAVAGTNNYTSLSKTVPFSIEKAASSVTTAPTAKPNLTYTGEAQPLVTPGAAAGGTMQYSTDGENYSADIPTAANAGQYTVYYKVVGGDNYSGTEPVKVSVTIAPKPITGAVALSGTATMAETLTANYTGGAGGETLAYQWYRDDTAISGATGSTYTIVADDVGHALKVKVSGTVNYSGSVTSMPTATVGQATPTVTWPTAGDITYGQTLAKSTLTGGEADVAGTFAWRDPTIQPTVADSGVTDYTVVFTPTVAGYSTVEKALMLTVNKADPQVTAPTANTLTYTGSAQTLVTAGGTSDGTLWYSLDGTNYKTELPVGTDAGRYTVSYKVVGDGNHSDTQPQSVPVTIAPKRITGSVTISGKANVGQTLTAVYAPGDPKETVDYQWYRGDTPIETATGSTYAIVTADLGHAIKVVVSGTGNYTGETASTPTAAVGKTLPVVTKWPTAGAITYGQTLKDSPLTDGAVDVEGEFTWKAPATQPTVADSGSTEYEVTFTPTNTDTYSILTGTATLTVHKATPAVTVTANTLTYNGTAQTLVTAEMTGGGTLQYSQDGATYSANLPTAIDAGEYTVSYKVVGDENYNDVAAQPVKVIIARKQLTGTLSISGTAKMDETLTANYTAAAETVTYQWYRGETAINGATGSTYKIGTADVGRVLKVTVSGTGNYIGDVTSAATAAVGKTTPVITWPTASAITYGETLGDSELTGGASSAAGVFAWTDGTVKPNVSDSNKAPYGVTFTPEDGNSYETATGTVTVTVNEAAPTFTPPTANTLAYTGAAQALVTVGSTLDGTMQYSLQETEGYSATAPTGTNAGKYTVYYKVEGDGNHSDTQPQSVDVTIGKVTLTPEVGSVADKDYDGDTDTTGTIALTGAVNDEHPTATGTFTFDTADVGENKPVNVTEITLSDPWGVNYALAPGDLTATADIAAKNIAGAAVTLGGSLTYTGQEQTQKVSEVMIGGLEVTTYTVSDNTGTDARTYALTVTGTGNFTGSVTKDFSIAQAGNSISNFTCGDIIHGETPRPSADADFGEIKYTYSRNENGPFAEWNSDSQPGKWYVKAGVVGTDNYAGADEVISFKETAQREATPNAKIEYPSETLTGLAAGTYTLTPAGGEVVTEIVVDGGVVKILAAWFGKDLSIVKVAQSEDWLNSFAQILPIPARPAAPAIQGVNETVDGREDGKITGLDDGTAYQISNDNGAGWTDAAVEEGAIPDLAPGTYQVRLTATGSAFAGVPATVTIKTGKDRTYTLNLTVPTFAAVAQSYARPEAKALTITSSGNSDSTISAVTVSGDAFTIGEGDETVPAGGSIDTWTIRPVAGLAPGVYTSDVTVTYNNGATVTKQASFTVKEATPDIQIDYTAETLTGFLAGGTYTIDDEEVTPDAGTLPAGDYMGKTISIVKKGAAGTDSAPRELEVPNRPAAPAGPKAVDETIQNKKDGKITGIDGTIQYKTDGKWQDGPADLEDLPAGTAVTVRSKATPSAFASQDRTLTVGAGRTLTVTFDARGGSPVPDAITGLSYEATASKPLTDPDKVGFTFYGWYMEPNCINRWDFSRELTDDLTLYAKWAVTTYSISGIVEENKNPVEGAEVRLMQGKQQIGATYTTEADGVYSFSGVAPGVYNVVATKGGRTMTILVTITNGPAEGQDLTMPTDQVNSILKVEGAATPDVVVGGLEQVAAANKPTESASSTTVTVTMTVESKPEAQVEKAEAEAIKAQAQEQTGADTTLEYLEIKVEKEVKPDNAPVATTPITTTQNLLKVVIPFDFSGKDRDSIKVYRFHKTDDNDEGRVDTLTTAVNGADEYIELGADAVILHVKNFSAYAIGYTEASSEPAPTPGSGGATTYAPTVIQPDHGKIEVTPSKPKKGDKVEITVTPNDGYEVDEVIVTDKGGKPVAVTKNPDGTYTFTQPTGKVTISAVMKKAVPPVGTCPKDAACPAAPFTDLDLKAWYHDGIHFCVEKGLMVGTSATTFAPETPTSRAMIVTILWRLQGSKVVNYALQYEDVPGGAWYTEAVRWATSEGIVKGYDADTFGPDDPITREQLAVMLYRCEQKYGGGGFTGTWMFPLDFTDAQQVSSWADEAMHWMVMNKVITGKGDKVLDPLGHATRAEAAAMIQRFFTLHPAV